MKDDTTLKNIRIISGITGETSTTAMGATTAIIIMCRTIDTMINTALTIVCTSIDIDRLKNTAAAGATARFTATHRVT